MTRRDFIIVLGGSIAAMPYVYGQETKRKLVVFSAAVQQKALRTKLTHFVQVCVSPLVMHMRTPQ